MAGYNPSVIEPVTAQNVVVPTTSITEVVSTGPVSTPGPDATVTIHGIVYISAGAGATLVFVGIYRGPVSDGIQVAHNVVQTVVGGDVYVIPFDFEDTPGDVAGETYSVAVNQSSATGNGTASYALIGGFVS